MPHIDDGKAYEARVTKIPSFCIRRATGASIESSFQSAVWKSCGAKLVEGKPELRAQYCRPEVRSAYEDGPKIGETSS